MVIPVYLPENVPNAARLAEMAVGAGIDPVTFCNSGAALAQAAAAGVGSVQSCGENVGYGRAANLAAEGRRFSWLILCNDDLQIEPAEFDRFLEAVRSQQSAEPWTIGAVSWTEPDRPSFPGLKSVFANLSLLAATKDRLTSSASRERRQSLLPQFVAVPRGTVFPFVCVAFSAASWRAAGGFDNRYPLYFEDMDYLRRASEIPEHRFGIIRASIRHRGSSTTRATLDRSLPLLAWSAYQYLERFTRWNPSAIRPVLGLALLVRLALIPFATSPVRAHARGIARALGVLRTRRPPEMPPWAMAR